MDRLRAISKVVVDAIFVQICAECERRGQWVCAVCLPSVQPIDVPGCLRCGSISASGCQCSLLPAEISRMESVYPYAGWVKSSIHRLKYNGEFARAEMLASHLLALTDTIESADVLIPVPMHRNRQQLRGFNQAERIARHLSNSCGIPVASAILRTVDTGTQVGRGQSARWESVKGAFECIDTAPIRGRNLLIVDDVITTGATVSHCAVELMRAGAASVSAISIARGG